MCALLLLQDLGVRMIAEATAVGLVFALWWRSTHANEKAMYDKYYANLRGACVHLTHPSLHTQPALRCPPFPSLPSRQQLHCLIADAPNRFLTDARS